MKFLCHFLVAMSAALSVVYFLDSVLVNGAHAVEFEESIKEMRILFSNPAVDMEEPPQLVAEMLANQFLQGALSRRTDVEIRERRLLLILGKAYGYLHLPLRRWRREQRLRRNVIGLQT